jgi:hypothetical protein
MINVHYFNETGIKINYVLEDWDALLAVAQILTNAPIDVDYLYLDDGVFNLHTFEGN